MQVSFFVSNLIFYLETKIDLDCCTRFKVNMSLYEDELFDQEKMKLAVTKTHVLEEICSFVKQWMRQITMVSSLLLSIQNVLLYIPFTTDQTNNEWIMPLLVVTQRVL